MTGADLRRLRWAYALDSSRRLAARLGCHRTTIDRGMRRRLLTEYVRARILTHPTAAPFWRGLNYRRNRK